MPTPSWTPGPPTSSQTPFLTLRPPPWSSPWPPQPSLTPSWILPDPPRTHMTCMSCSSIYLVVQEGILLLTWIVYLRGIQEGVWGSVSCSSICLRESKRGPYYSYELSVCLSEGDLGGIWVVCLSVWWGSRRGWGLSVCGISTYN